MLGGQQAISDEERMAVASDLIGRLWATVQKGRYYLDGKLADESQADADAVLEEVLGHAWQLTELRDKGYVRQNMQLLELAHELTDDEARQERVETSYLLTFTPSPPPGEGRILHPSPPLRGRGVGVRRHLPCHHLSAAQRIEVCSGTAELHGTVARQ